MLHYLFSIYFLALRLADKMKRNGISRAADGKWKRDNVGYGRDRWLLP